LNKDKQYYSLRPDHLGKNEQDLVNDFLTQYGITVENIKFDMALMPRQSNILTDDSEYLKNWSILTAPRIDMVANIVNGKPVIFEVRPEADWTAISAVIAYTELFKTVTPWPYDILMAIICRNMSDTNKRICKLFDIQLFIIPSKI